MSVEIPDDIMAIGLKMADEYADWVERGNTSATLSGHAIEAMADTIARAIMAERERCAAIADEQVTREEYGHAKHAAVTIAQRIREGTP